MKTLFTILKAYFLGFRKLNVRTEDVLFLRYFNHTPHLQKFGVYNYLTDGKDTPITQKLIDDIKRQANAKFYINTKNKQLLVLGETETLDYCKIHNPDGELEAYKIFKGIL